MAQEINKCFFCGEEAEGEKDITRGFFYVRCTECGYYWLHDKILQKHLTDHSTKKAGAQAMINCAYHNVISMENTANEDYVPVWLSNHESIKYLEQGMRDHPEQFNKGPTGIVFSDIAFDSVNHSNKADDLLAAASKQLENDEPFDPFSFRAVDRIKAKV